MATINTCKDCTERHLKCHASCQKYLDAKAKHAEEMELKAKDVASQLYQYKVESIRKYRKRRGK